MSGEYRIETNVLLTPEKAVKWLETVKHNREVRQWRVNQYAQQMKEKQWRKETGETMKFDSNGEFRDGQHRAWAVVESGVSIIVDVTYNVDPDVVRIIDTGERRTGADTLNMESKNEGREKLPHSKIIATALNVVYAWFETKDVYKKTSLNNEKMWQYFGQHREIERSAEFVSRKGKLASAALCAALHYILSRNQSKKAEVDAFFDTFISGENLSKGSPVLALRARLINQRNEGKASCGREFTLACILIAWRAYVKGRTLQFITYNADAKPQPNKFVRT